MKLNEKAGEGDGGGRAEEERRERRKGEERGGPITVQRIVTNEPFTHPFVCLHLGNAKKPRKPSVSTVAKSKNLELSCEVRNEQNKPVTQCKIDVFLSFPIPTSPTPVPPSSTLAAPQ